jgi:MFS family permease
VKYYDIMQNKEDISNHTVRNILTHDFVFGFLGLFTFIVAYHALIPTLPIFFASLGSNEREIGVLVGIFGGSSLVFRLVVGSILLKYSEKSIMMFGALLFAVTFLASIVLRPFWPFFAVRFFQGVAFAFIDTAALAFIIKVTPPVNRGRAISYFVLAPPFSQAIAPSFGMFIINRYSFTVLFLICVGLSLCAFFFSWNVKGQETVAPDKNISTNNSTFLDLKIIAPSIMSFLQNFVWGGIIAFFPLYAIKCGITNPGYFFSANAVMLIAGRALGGRILDAYSKEKIIRTFIFTSMVAVVILAFSKTLPMFIVVGFLWGTGGAFLFPASMAYALDYAGSSGGTAVGTFRVLADLGLAMGPVLMGIIIPFTGYQGMFLCLALTSLINLCYFQFYVKKKGQRR